MKSIQFYDVTAPEKSAANAYATAASPYATLELIAPEFHSFNADYMEAIEQLGALLAEMTSLSELAEHDASAFYALLDEANARINQSLEFIAGVAEQEEAAIKLQKLVAQEFGADVQDKNISEISEVFEQKIAEQLGVDATELELMHTDAAQAQAAAIVSAAVAQNATVANSVQEAITAATQAAAKAEEAKAQAKVAIMQSKLAAEEIKMTVKIAKIAAKAATGDAEAVAAKAVYEAQKAKAKEAKKAAKAAEKQLKEAAKAQIKAAKEEAKKAEKAAKEAIKEAKAAGANKEELKQLKEAAKAEVQAAKEQIKAAKEEAKKAEKAAEEAMKEAVQKAKAAIDAGKTPEAAAAAATEKLPSAVDEVANAVEKAEAAIAPSTSGGAASSSAAPSAVPNISGLQKVWVGEKDGWMFGLGFSDAQKASEWSDAHADWSAQKSITLEQAMAAGVKSFGDFYLEAIDGGNIRVRLAEGDELLSAGTEAAVLKPNTTLEQFAHLHEKSTADLSTILAPVVSLAGWEVDAVNEKITIAPDVSMKINLEPGEALWTVAAKQMNTLEALADFLKASEITGAQTISIDSAARVGTVTVDGTKYHLGSELSIKQLISIASAADDEAAKQAIAAAGQHAATTAQVDASPAGKTLADINDVANMQNGDFIELKDATDTDVLALLHKNAKGELSLSVDGKFSIYNISTSAKQTDVIAICGASGTMAQLLAIQGSGRWQFAKLSAEKGNLVKMKDAFDDDNEHIYVVAEDAPLAKVEAFLQMTERIDTRAMLQPLKDAKVTEINGCAFDADNETITVKTNTAILGANTLTLKLAAQGRFDLLELTMRQIQEGKTWALAQADEAGVQAINGAQVSEYDKVTIEALGAKFTMSNLNTGALLTALESDGATLKATQLMKVASDLNVKEISTTHATWLTQYSWLKIGDYLVAPYDTHGTPDYGSINVEQFLDIADSKMSTLKTLFGDGAKLITADVSAGVPVELENAMAVKIEDGAVSLLLTNGLSVQLDDNDQLSELAGIADSVAYNNNAVSITGDVADTDVVITVTDGNDLPETINYDTNDTSAGTYTVHTPVLSGEKSITLENFSTGDKLVMHFATVAAGVEVDSGSVAAESVSNAPGELTSAVELSDLEAQADVTAASDGQVYGFASEGQYTLYNVGTSGQTDDGVKVTISGLPTGAYSVEFDTAESTVTITGTVA